MNRPSYCAVNNKMAYLAVDVQLSRIITTHKNTESACKVVH